MKIFFLLGVLCISSFAFADEVNNTMPAKTRIGCSNEISQAQMNAILPMFASGSHRQWHLNWHQVRRMAKSPVDYPGQRLAAQLAQKCPIGLDVFAKAAANATPMFINAEQIFSYYKTDNAVAEAFLKQHNVVRDQFEKEHQIIVGRIAGEDFFYMHRLMLQMMQTSLAGAGLQCVAPWTDLPPVNDKVWPTLIARDSQATFWDGETGDKIARAAADQKIAEEWIQKLRDPAYLRTVSLSDYGSCVENTIHSYMHMVYADRESHCGDENDTSLSCNHLIPEYSSQTNPYFWKLHGLVDGLVQSWLEAQIDETGQAKYIEISMNCDGRPKCYSWDKAVWLGDM